MATLVKTGIGDQQTLTPVMITELYDAFTGEKLFDNISVNNTMKVYHDGRIAISRPGHSKSAPYALTVYGDIQGYVGRFNEVISNTMTFITSSGLIVSGSNMFGGLDTDTHVFTGSLFVSGSQSVSNFFLNKVGIGTSDVSDGHMLQVVGGVDVSTYVSSSILHVTQTASIQRLGIGTNIPDTVLHVVGDSGITLEESGESTRKLILEPPDGSTSAIIRADGSANGLLLRSDGGGNQIFLKNDGNVGIGTTNPVKKLTIAGAISASGNLDVDGISIFDGDITGSSNLRIEGTASFGHMDFSPSVNITSGSFGSLNITDMTIDNQVGLDREIVGINKEGKIDFTYPDRATINVKNLNGTTLSAGTPIFISSYVSDEVYGVVAANSNNPDKRPASGIITEQIGINETGSATVSGVIRGEDVDTSAHSVGTKLYLGSSELTSTKPSTVGTAIQSVTVVLKQSSTFGEMLLLPSAGVSNDTEVLEIDHVFLGSGSLTENIHLSGALDRTTLTNVTGIGTASFGKLEISGKSSLTGDVTFGGEIAFNDLNVSGEVSGSLLPKTDIGFDLGSPSKRWNQIYVNSITSNANISSSLLSTGSFGHVFAGGNIYAAGEVSADSFVSRDGNSTISFEDDVAFGADDSITSIQNITATGNISSSLSSTGSFGHLHIDDKIGIGIKDPSTILHISGTDGLIIPVGNTSQRSSDAKQGEIRFNAQLQSYEGYDGNNWGTLGGMADVDQDTKITAENSAGDDNDELKFFTAGSERLKISAQGHVSASGNITASANLEVHGNISGSSTSTGSFGLVEIAGIDINPSGIARDQVLKFNGTNFVAADPDDTFVFTIADFDTNDGTTPQLIGTGSWKAPGALTFTATYNNGPPDGHSGGAEGAPKITSIVDGSTSGSDMFPLSSSFSTGTNNRAIMFPPDSSDDIRFRLFASAGSDTDNEFSDQRIYFFNQFVFGDLSKNNGFNQADIRTLASENTVTSNDTTRTLSVSIGASNYLNFAHRTGDTNVAQVYSGNDPNRLTVAMDRSDATTITPLKETVSYLNTAGKTENFFVYASKEQNIDAHSSTFVTTTSTQKKNYIYWGAESSWTNNESNVEALDNKSTTYDDGSITGNTLSVGTFTSKFVIVAIPNRYGDNDTNYQFKDNSTNLPFAFDQQSDVTITNAVGFQEDYSVYKSTNQLTMTNATVLIDSV